MLTRLKKSVLLGLAAITLVIGFVRLDQTVVSTSEQVQPMMAENGYESGGG